MNITVDEFMKNSYVISCSQQKYETFCKIFQNSGFKIMPKMFRGVCIKNGNRGHSNTLNCSLAHYCLIRMAQQLNLPFVCIFEDDAVPHKDIQKLLPSYLTDIPDDIGIMKLGWSQFAQECDPKTPPPQALTEKLRIAKTWGSHSYVVFRSYYEQIVHILESDDLAIDWAALAWKPTTDQNLFVQYNGETSNKVCLTAKLQTKKQLQIQGIDINDYHLDENLHN